ncbi:M16 family metallopeptidase [Celeribacter indicus]|uniref:Peptidase M16 domain-containing protein n=1 Tax=Celeribacter indicus TaxID=1208324 RepID=A0A0B5DPX2_9RHOB|nr:pitrilysin family protein [Celeribacter indicus]AJE45164.1 peptidase M16 domain-containing protein [Celeribacter indicus]SDX26052.1 zinc protease [Celeribacter indicus]
MKRFAIALIAYVAFLLPAFAAVEVQEVETPGGIKAWLVEEHSIPFTALEIRFRGGTSLDREGKRGEITLMMATLEEGAGDMDAQDFAAARDALAASFDFDARMDSVSISARFLSENRDEALALLRKAIMEPRFDQTAVDRVRGQVQSILRSQANDPQDIASTSFYSAVFPGHPYGTNDTGTPESVAGLTREDMIEAKARAMVRDRAYVGAVGDITAEELSSLLDDLLGGLPETGPDLPERVEPELSGEVTVVPFATPQSVVLFGQKGLTRDHPDFIPAYIANEILGGGPDSRLMSEVREKRGLTYGIGSYLVPFDHSELLLGQFSSGNASVAQAIEVVKAEWRKIVEEGISEEELADAKTYLTGAYPLRFDGNGPIASILVDMQMDGLSRDYIAERNDMVNAVTLEEINRVARELYDPDRLSFVVVGQPEGLGTN